MTEKTNTTTEKYGLDRYFLLTMSLSLLGWAFETAYLFFATGRYCDRGFMTLPFCPIYGCSLVFVYFLVGTPDEGKFLLKKAEKRGLRYALYFLFAFLIPSAMELIVGLFFDKTLQIRLWDYSSRLWNVNGYVCIRNSLIWAALIFLFMKFLFPPIKNFIGKLPKSVTRVLAFALLLATLIDVSLNLGRVLY